jgi:hypothetical protein
LDIEGGDVEVESRRGVPSEHGGLVAPADDTGRLRYAWFARRKIPRFHYLVIRRGDHQRAVGAHVQRRDHINVPQQALEYQVGGSAADVIVMPLSCSCSIQSIVAAPS